MLQSMVRLSRGNIRFLATYLSGISIVPSRVMYDFVRPGQERLVLDISVSVLIPSM